MLPPSLQLKLDTRREQGAYRSLRPGSLPVDFCSNDYLGISRGHLLHHDPTLASGSTGSRLLAGNYPLLSELETEIAAFHHAEAALLYNSGYDANLGLLSSILQKDDTILYDALAHASIRDGIRLSFARSFSFRHNDMEDLDKKLQSMEKGGDIGRNKGGNIYVVTESLFSMDGDFCPLASLKDICRRHGAWLIVDEAHATGIVGERGEGLVQMEGAEEDCFARVHTFGKALGCHGAVVLGSTRLKEYLVNFSRSLIYTTALPPSSADLIRQSYKTFPSMNKERMYLQEICDRFQAAALPFETLHSPSPIQAVLIPGNDRVRAVAASLQQAGIDARPILYPTVPKDTERLRIVLHAFNTAEEVDLLVDLLNAAKIT